MKLFYPVQVFFNKTQQHEIQEAIAQAEHNTSGEIRVHIERSCKGEPVECAVKVFEKLKMHETVLKNGVLFYLSVKDRKFAVIGDKGINDVVPPDFWDTIKEKMLSNFIKNNFTEGLCEGIKLAGTKLKEHFPFQKNDTNELPNEISFGKNKE